LTRAAPVLNFLFSPLSLSSLCVWVCGCRSGLSEGASLADLVAVGLNDNEVATSVLVDLKAEVRTPTRP
jgi:hypothetical protein